MKAKLVFGFGILLATVGAAHAEGLYQQKKVYPPYYAPPYHYSPPPPRYYYHRRYRRPLVRQRYGPQNQIIIGGDSYGDAVIMNQN